MSSDIGTQLGQFRPLCNLHLCHRVPDAGMDRWTRDFCLGDPFSDNFVLEAVGEPDLPILEYNLVDGRSGRRIDNLFLRSPIDESEGSRCEYRGFIEALFRSRSIAHLYISSMYGHSQELIEAGLPVTIIHHEQLPGWDLRDRYWRATSTGQVNHVARSHNYVHQLVKMDSRFREMTFAIIANGIEVAPNCFGGATDGRRLRLLVLGDLTSNEMVGFFIQCFEALRLIADLYLVDCGELELLLLNRWGVTIAACSDRGGLTESLSNISPDIGLVSIPPHSDGYELLELKARGIPPIGAYGSSCEHIEHKVGGFQFSPNSSALMLLLAELDSRRDVVRKVACHLRNHSQSSVRQMICRYYSLRPDVPDVLDQMLERNREVGFRP